MLTKYRIYGFQWGLVMRTPNKELAHRYKDSHRVLHNHINIQHNKLSSNKTRVLRGFGSKGLSNEDASASTEFPAHGARTPPCTCLRQRGSATKRCLPASRFPRAPGLRGLPLGNFASQDLIFFCAVFVEALQKIVEICGDEESAQKLHR